MGRYNQNKSKRSGRYNPVKNKDSDGIYVVIVIILILLASAGGFFARQLMDEVNPEVRALAIPFDAKSTNTAESSQMSVADNEQAQASGRIKSCE